MSEEKKEMKKSSSPAKDLTVGSPMKLILGFAFPMFLGLLFQQFYSLVDTMIWAWIHLQALARQAV